MEYAKNMGCMINTLGVGLHTTSMQIPDFFKKKWDDGGNFGFKFVFMTWY